jgi:hypothetical protein
VGKYCAGDVGNNNHLFRQNHKKSYSLPQRLPVGRPVGKCVAGYDYLLLLSNRSLFCYFQSALYHLAHFTTATDIATTDNMIVVLTADGAASIAEFNADKVVAGELTFAPIRLSSRVDRLFMSHGEVFLVDDQQQAFHLKRNEWYETKSYSDPQPVEGLAGRKIKTIAPALAHNYFLTEDGRVFLSSKQQPTKPQLSSFKQKFVEIAASEYFIGIADNGRLYVCGKYLDQTFDAPTEFGKISQKFVKVSLSSENGFAITEKGEGWVWGKNANGELGISDYEPRNQPFPLVTLQSDSLTEFVLGEGFTVCLAQNPHAKKPQSKLYEIASGPVPVHEPTKSSHFMISSIPSISIVEAKRAKSKSPTNAHPAKTEILRDNAHRHHKADSSTPSKQPNRSKSPC